MSRSNSISQSLRNRIRCLETELGDLKKQLLAAEAAELTNSSIELTSQWAWPLDSEEYQRYGRQMIMPEVGLQGQLNLKNASVLIVGVGGLGCPAAAYMAGAGVGNLGLVDGDTVEVSNLHRQILHTSDRVGMLKVDSAIESLTRLNPKVHYVSHPASLTSSTALDTFKHYDLILDCTDHPSSRYLISDAAVLAGKPLISASALRTEGQLMVLNNPPSAPEKIEGGFCYRCVFPTPPPAESVMSCGEGGILGPVVGVMGVLMAVEAIKVLVASVGTSTIAMKTEPSNQTRPSLLLYSAYGSPPFRSIRLRGKRTQCPACSETATITRESLTSGSLDYATFCGITCPAHVLNDADRISAVEYNMVRGECDEEVLLIDVREEVQFNICHLKNSINIPFSTIIAAADGSAYNEGRSDIFNSIAQHIKPPGSKSIYCICRYGNDSQLAVQLLKEWGFTDNLRGDIQGGLHAWRKEVDPTFPEY